jgi:hypothetical protein
MQDVSKLLVKVRLSLSLSLSLCARVCARAQLCMYDIVYVSVSFCTFMPPLSVFFHRAGGGTAAAQSYHVSINARSERDLDPATVMKKVADAGGAKYSVHEQTAAAAAAAVRARHRGWWWGSLHMVRQWH